MKNAQRNRMGQTLPAGLPLKQGLYDPAYEHDSCGVGFVAHIKGKRSHQILIDAEEVLRNMDHRGACGCEPNTGDGAGILTALPHDFLKRVVKSELGANLPKPGQFAAGIVFLPKDAVERARCKLVVDELIAAQGQKLIGWRPVPTETDKSDIGPTAKAGEPHIEMLVIAAGKGVSGDAFERQLY
ncbi:MAG TPA: glutamate synthase subunit alpha, partial [Lacipirellulaceae bacterium]|nr:glutamate synthase subunit alpha [Lacipirellulaceae bacterium]